MRPCLLVPGLALALALASAACAGGLAGDPWATTYRTQPEREHCRRVPDASAAAWAHRAMCGGRGDRETDALAVDPVAEPAGAAAGVALCAAKGCTGDGALAAAWLAAERAAPDAVVAALAAPEIDPILARDFVARYRAARDRVAALVSARGATWRAVWIDPAVAARAARDREDAALAPWVAKLDALAAELDPAVLDGRVPPDAGERATSLRASYFEACALVRTDPTLCWSDAIARAATRLVIRIARAAEDPVTLAAEAALAGLPDRSDPRTDERRAAEAALARAVDERRAYERARAAGTSAALIAARWPSPPIEIRRARTLVGLEARAAAEPIARTAGAIVSDEVRDVARRGGVGRVRFRARVDRFTSPTGCHETGKIDRVENGTVIYRVECTGPDRAVKVDKTLAPVEVPWREAATLRPGDVVELVVDRDRGAGHVRAVRTHPGPGAAVIQYRDLRVPPEAPAAREVSSSARRGSRRPGS